jgi:hypothetical protein
MEKYLVHMIYGCLVLDRYTVKEPVKAQLRFEMDVYSTLLMERDSPGNPHGTSHWKSDGYFQAQRD